MSKKSKRSKDRDNYQSQNTPQNFNPNMPHLGYNPNMMNPNMMNPNMMNPNMMNPNMMNPNMMNPNMMNPNMQGQNMNQNPQGQTDLNALMGILNNIDPNQLISMLTQSNTNQSNQGGNPPIPNMDQASSLLNALRPFMPPERISMVEKVLRNLNSQNSNQK